MILDEVCEEGGGLKEVVGFVLFDFVFIDVESGVFDVIVVVVGEDVEVVVRCVVFVEVWV